MNTRLLASLLIVVSLTAGAAIDVASRATAGTGTPTDPWKGWDTAILWQGENEYFFKTGYYSYLISPNFLRPGIALRGEAGTVLQFNGPGNAVIFDNPGGLSPISRNWTHNVRMENFIIQGNPTATNGLFLRGVRNGTFRHISIRDVTNAGVWTEALANNIFENIRVSHHEMPDDRFNVVPAYGIVLASRGADATTTTTFTNPVVEGVRTIGIWIQAGSNGNTFINGTSEGNKGKGMVIDGWMNNIINTDFEANETGIDMEISGSSNELQGVFSSHLIDVKAGQMNKLRGSFNRVNIASTCDFTDVSGAYLNGTLTDSSFSTVKYGYHTGQGGLNPGNALTRDGTRRGGP